VVVSDAAAPTAAIAFAAAAAQKASLAEAA